MYIMRLIKINNAVKLYKNTSPKLIDKVPEYDVYENHPELMYKEINLEGNVYQVRRPRN